MRTVGEYRSPEDVEDIVVAVRDDVPIYLRDVAEARLGYRKARYRGSVASGCVDHRIDEARRSQGARSVVNDLVELFPVGDTGYPRQRACGTEFLCQSGNSARRYVHQNHKGTLGVEQPCACSTDATSGTGDQDRFVVQI